jgi:hypothetical protein
MEQTQVADLAKYGDSNVVFVLCKSFGRRGLEACTEFYLDLNVIKSSYLPEAIARTLSMKFSGGKLSSKEEENVTSGAAYCYELLYMHASDDDSEFTFEESVTSAFEEMIGELENLCASKESPNYLSLHSQDGLLGLLEAVEAVEDFGLMEAIAFSILIEDGTRPILDVPKTSGWELPKVIPFGLLIDITQFKLR